MYRPLFFAELNFLNGRANQRLSIPVRHPWMCPQPRKISGKLVQLPLLALGKPSCKLRMSRSDLLLYALRGLERIISSGFQCPRDHAVFGFHRVVLSLSPARFIAGALELKLKLAQHSVLLLVQTAQCCQLHLRTAP